MSENTPSPLSSVITIDLLWEFGGVWAVLGRCCPVWHDRGGRSGQ